MTRFLNTFVLSLLATLASYGCSGSSPSGPSETLPDLIAGNWRLVAQQPAGEQESAPPPGSTFVLEIVDGRASVTADCNRCNGAATVGSDRVTFGPALACTRAYCTTSAPFDSTFVRLLADESAASVQGETLTLRSPRGTLRFRR